MTGDPATDLLSDMKTRCKSLPCTLQNSRGTLGSSTFSSNSAGNGHMATLTLIWCSISVLHSLYLGRVLAGIVAEFWWPSDLLKDMII